MNESVQLVPTADTGAYPAVISSFKIQLYTLPPQTRELRGKQIQSPGLGLAVLR